MINPDPTQSDLPPRDDQRGSIEAIDRAAEEQDSAVNGGLGEALRHNLADDVTGERDRADGARDTPGIPGGTMGTGGSSEQDA